MSSFSLAHDAITFSDTATYGRLISQTDKRDQSKNDDDPEIVKYTKGFGVSFAILNFIECQRTPL